MIDAQDHIAQDAKEQEKSNQTQCVEPNRIRKLIWFHRVQADQYILIGNIELPRGVYRCLAGILLRAAQAGWEFRVLDCTAIADWSGKYVF